MVLSGYFVGTPLYLGSYSNVSKTKWRGFLGQMFYDAESRNSYFTLDSGTKHTIRHVLASKLTNWQPKGTDAFIDVPSNFPCKIAIDNKSKDSWSIGLLDKIKLTNVDSVAPVFVVKKSFIVYGSRYSYASSLAVSKLYLFFKKTGQSVSFWFYNFMFFDGLLIEKTTKNALAFKGNDLFGSNSFICNYAVEAVFLRIFEDLVISGIDPKILNNSFTKSINFNVGRFDCFLTTLNYLYNLALLSAKKTFFKLLFKKILTEFLVNLCLVSINESGDVLQPGMSTTYLTEYLTFNIKTLLNKKFNFLLNFVKGFEFFSGFILFLVKKLVLNALSLKANILNSNVLYKDIRAGLISFFLLRDRFSLYGSSYFKDKLNLKFYSKKIDLFAYDFINSPINKSLKRKFKKLKYFKSFKRFKVLKKQRNSTFFNNKKETLRTFNKIGYRRKRITLKSFLFKRYKTFATNVVINKFRVFDKQGSCFKFISNWSVSFFNFFNVFDSSLPNKVLYRTLLTFFKSVNRVFSIHNFITQLFRVLFSCNNGSYTPFKSIKFYLVSVLHNWKNIFKLFVNFVRVSFNKNTFNGGLSNSKTSNTYNLTLFDKKSFFPTRNTGALPINNLSLRNKSLIFFWNSFCAKFVEIFDLFNNSYAVYAKFLIKFRKVINYFGKLKLIVNKNFGKVKENNSLLAHNLHNLLKNYKFLKTVKIKRGVLYAAKLRGVFYNKQNRLKKCIGYTRDKLVLKQKYKLKRNLNLIRNALVLNRNFKSLGKKTKIRALKYKRSFKLLRALTVFSSKCFKAGSDYGFLKVLLLGGDFFFNSILLNLFKDFFFVYNLSKTRSKISNEYCLFGSKMVNCFFWLNFIEKPASRWFNLAKLHVLNRSIYKPHLTGVSTSGLTKLTHKSKLSEIILEQVTVEPLYELVKKTYTQEDYNNLQLFGAQVSVLNLCVNSVVLNVNTGVFFYGWAFYFTKYFFYSKIARFNGFLFSFYAVDFFSQIARLSLLNKVKSEKLLKLDYNVGLVLGFNLNSRKPIYNCGEFALKAIGCVSSNFWIRYLIGVKNLLENLTFTKVNYSETFVASTNKHIQTFYARSYFLYAVRKMNYKRFWRKRRKLLSVVSSRNYKLARNIKHVGKSVGVIFFRTIRKFVRKVLRLPFQRGHFYLQPNHVKRLVILYKRIKKKTKLKNFLKFVATYLIRRRAILKLTKILKKPKALERKLKRIKWRVRKTKRSRSNYKYYLKSKNVWFKKLLQRPFLFKAFKNYRMGGLKKKVKSDSKLERISRWALKRDKGVNFSRKFSLRRSGKIFKVLKLPKVFVLSDILLSNKQLWLKLNKTITSTFKNKIKDRLIYYLYNIAINAGGAFFVSKYIKLGLYSSFLKNSWWNSVVLRRNVADFYGIRLLRSNFLFKSVYDRYKYKLNNKAASLLGYTNRTKTGFFVRNYQVTILGSLLKKYKIRKQFNYITRRNNSFFSEHFLQGSTPKRKWLRLVRHFKNFKLNYSIYLTYAEVFYKFNFFNTPDGIRQSALFLPTLKLIKFINKILISLPRITVQFLKNRKRPFLFFSKRLYLRKQRNILTSAKRITKRRIIVSLPKPKVLRSFFGLFAAFDINHSAFSLHKDNVAFFSARYKHTRYYKHIFLVCVRRLLIKLIKFLPKTGKVFSLKQFSKLLGKRSRNVEANRKKFSKFNLFKRARKKKINIFKLDWRED